MTEQGDRERKARQMALDLLGPGAAVSGFRAELRRWFTRSITLASKEGDDFGPQDACEDCGATVLCAGCVSDMIDDDMPRGHVHPTAFRIHREAEWCQKDESWFVIDVVVVGSRANLRKNLGEWIRFGSDIDYTDEAFLRLRFFDEAFKPVAEYNEEALYHMDIAPEIGRASANDPL